MLKRTQGKDSGIVFVTVLMVIIVMAVLTVSIISLNINQAIQTEEETKRIQAESLAMSGLALMIANQNSGAPSSTLTFSNTVGNITYTTTATIAGPGAGNTNFLNITVSY